MNNFIKVLAAIFMVVCGIVIGFAMAAHNALAPYITVTKEVYRDTVYTFNYDAAQAKNPKLISSKEFNHKGITLESYDKGCYDSKATATIKNNTNKTLHKINVRIIYKDMKGNQLDYEDVCINQEIASGLAKIIELPGYNQSDYAYYKSETSYSHPNNKYKIDFVLMSYE